MATNDQSLQIDLLENSFAQVKPQADAFGASFYNNLFTMYPEAKPLFANTDMAAQQKKLISSLVLVVENLGNPDTLQASLQGLGARHVEYGALPEHYPLVGNALLKTFEDYLQESWTPEVKQAWVDAYNEITKIMLEGANYSSDSFQLTASPNAETSTSSPTKTENASSTGEINWPMVGGSFLGIGILTVLLLLLL